MIEPKDQTKHFSELLPKIAGNLKIASLVDKVRPGLTTSQLMILLILKETKGTPLPIGKLAQELDVSFPTVSGIVERMHKEKLVGRTHDRQDRRIVLIKLTKEGEQITEKLLTALDRLVFRVLDKMPRTEREIVMNAIEKVFVFSTILSKDAE